MKPPLVLIHGWGVNSNIWQPIVAPLASQFDVTLIDLPGYGADTEHGGDYSLEAIVKAVLDRAPPLANWVGWSLGGTAALAAALAHPDRFMKLQLVSTTPCFINGADWEFGVEETPYDQLAQDFDADYDKALKRFLLLQLFSNDRSQLKKNRSIVRDLLTILGELPPPTSETLRGGLEILKQVDLRPRLGELEVRTQVIAGQNDLVVPASASEYLFGQLKFGESLHLLQSGHLPFLEETDKYIGTLTSFLTTTP